MRSELTLANLWSSNIYNGVWCLSQEKERETAKEGEYKSLRLLGSMTRLAPQRLAWFIYLSLVKKLSLHRAKVLRPLLSKEPRISTNNFAPWIFRANNARTYTEELCIRLVQHRWKSRWRRETPYHAHLMPRFVYASSFRNYILSSFCAHSCTGKLYFTFAYASN